MPKILDAFKFCEELLETNDLDPVYVLLWEAYLPHDKLCKWLTAYWCFYHVGIASVLSESDHFWNDLKYYSEGTNAPRGVERRHFRGDIARSTIKSIQRISNSWSEYALKGSSEDFISSLLSDDVVRLPDIIAKIKRANGFGPWISFKIADMLERLKLQLISSEPIDVFTMFDAPKEGARILVDTYWPNTDKEVVYTRAYNELIERFGDYLSPPTYDRAINIQEIETLLCKYKSHTKGKYQPCHDILECRKALIKYSKCKTSQALLKAGKRAKLWEAIGR